MAEKRVGDWIYFCPQEIRVRALYELFADLDGAEIWEEAGVLEIPLEGGTSFDVEAAQIHPKDEITQQFAAEQGAKSIFLITFMPEDYVKAEVVMKQILNKFAGLFCGDTEDLQPRVR